MKGWQPTDDLVQLGACDDTLGNGDMLVRARAVVAELAVHADLHVHPCPVGQRLGRGVHFVDCAPKGLADSGCLLLELLIRGAVHPITSGAQLVDEAGEVGSSRHMQSMPASSACRDPRLKLPPDRNRPLYPGKDGLIFVVVSIRDDFRLDFPPEQLEN